MNQPATQRILVVEDDSQLRRTLELNLSARGYQVDVTGNGEDALVIAGRNLTDLMLLDLGLPGMDGVNVITSLRRWSAIPIIVISARGSETDKVDALDSGANDYLTKPFGIAELMARVRAALRTSSDDHRNLIVTDAFSVDFVRHLATRADGLEVHLTPIEWGLIAHLGRHPGRLVSQRTLLQAVWGPEYMNETNYLRVHMAHLRRKLEAEPSRPRHIITESGVGYRLVDVRDE